ncbi:hypothetical protein CYMTET_6072 [Cymbomonas tetramitiformis]|uniref:Uncharacterized protein n=1 Tax=Cymbomonas tetramitiformis TaxID=36881 RepID=A0AAE0LIS7_9CHLO|nr:hypothetical protein CYMTET_6072 [Cymbomonas tetramitiformis]
MQGVAGVIIRKVRAGAQPEMVGVDGEDVRGGMHPNPNHGKEARRLEVERLALMDKAWETRLRRKTMLRSPGRMDMVAVHKGVGVRSQGSLGRLPVGQAREGRMVSRLLETMEDVRH